MMLFKLAFRNILRQRRRSLLTGLTIVGGFVLCTFTFSLVEGAWGNAVDFYTLDSIGHIQVHWADYERKPKVHKTINHRRLVEQTLSANDDVKAFAPRVYSSALAYAGTKTTPVTVVGVDPDLEPKVSRLKEKTKIGQYYNNAHTRTAMIGAGIAKSLAIDVGDEIVLISQGADGSIANDLYPVTAIVGNKSSTDSRVVYLPLTTAQEFLSLGESVHEYVLLVRAPNDNEVVAKALETELHHNMSEITVTPWQVIDETFYRTMRSDKRANRFMLGILIFIIFIGVLNTVLMSVLERTREFGVIRAIGSRPSTIVQLIFVETMMLTTLCLAVSIILLVPILGWLVNVGFSLPEPVDLGGMTFSQIRGGVTPLVLLAPVAYIYSFTALVTILPAIRAASVTPKTAMGSH